LKEINTPKFDLLKKTGLTDHVIIGNSKRTVGIKIGKNVTIMKSPNRNSRKGCSGCSRSRHRGH
jgi:hypothetical protein